MAEQTTHMVGKKASDEDLTLCPVCGGYTQIYQDKIYCPNDKIFVSENPNDAMRAKVKFIKDETVDAPKRRAQASHQQWQTVKALGFLLITVVIIGVASYTGYFFLRAKAYENAGNYEAALASYTASQRIIPFPGIAEMKVKTQRLIASSQAFQEGERAWNEERWDDAVLYYRQVLEDDVNYARAQEKLRTATLKSANKR